MSYVKSCKIGALAIVGGSVIGLADSVWLGGASIYGTGEVLRVPWGQIAPALLVCALVVSYLVFEQRVRASRRVSETSPLGGRGPAPLVNGGLYLKVLLGVEALVTGMILVLPMLGRTWSAPDIGRVLLAGAIVAFIVHLVMVGMTRRMEGGPWEV